MKGLKRIDRNDIVNGHNIREYGINWFTCNRFGLVLTYHFNGEVEYIFCNGKFWSNILSCDEMIMHNIL